MYMNHSYMQTSILLYFKLLYYINNDKFSVILSPLSLFGDHPYRCDTFSECIKQYPTCTCYLMRHFSVHNYRTCPHPYVHILMFIHEAWSRIRLMYATWYRGWYNSVVKREMMWLGNACAWAHTYIYVYLCICLCPYVIQ